MSPGGSLFARRQSEFDAGLNTSAAWTKHLEREGSLSDEELDSTNQGIGELPTRPAQALYDFLGKPEFNELTVDAGDEIHVLKEDLPDGWSLVKAANIAGYLDFMADFVQEAETTGLAASTDSTESTTPRRSPALSKIVLQTTGGHLSMTSVRTLRTKRR
ncbi:hypothetical protein PC9H_008501 [Pleurotus ostreatus]|uniref:SH3 domain-containing protein n=1 Tax=Pleurotus ostreatus TaxID=5322 RepID=A0A8H7DQC1_PLEOS|nr:uncharacterized protein PC9H_008501 [Pleurotus ostreatus]KAF7426135.1 hypothetical protein PC9H_008501 [Pleurotus ostreatus]